MSSSSNRQLKRRKQILDGTLKVFSRKGITGTKMNLIATEAGISPGLLYRYFESKEEILITLVEIAINEAKDKILLITKASGSPMEKIKALTKEILDEQSQQFFMLIHQVRTSDEAPKVIKNLIAQYSLNSYVDLLEPLIIEGQNAGEFLSTDPRELISTYLMVLNGLMTLNIHDDPEYTMPRIELLLRIVSNDR